MKQSDALAALSALAHETRLAIFRALVPAGGEGRSAGDLAETLGVPAPTLSFHLKELEQAGLIAQRREGRSLFYSVDGARMRALLEFLTDDCCGGNPQMCLPRKKDSRNAC